jgi:hypothetical protein
MPQVELGNDRFVADDIITIDGSGWPCSEPKNVVQ